MEEQKVPPIENDTVVAGSTDSPSVDTSNASNNGVPIDSNPSVDVAMVANQTPTPK